jgi:hypothetical protein
MVTHTCNTSYSGDGYLEDHISEPDWAKGSRVPTSTNIWTWWNASVMPGIQEVQIGGMQPRLTWTLM